jgi:hypothetical protein
MAGGLLQLIAKGVSDLYITGNPEITMFKIVYRRHTHFSKYDKETDIKCNKFSSKIKHKFENNGDLILDSYLTFDMPIIKLLKNKPTYLYIKNLLKQLDINYVYDNKDDDLVTIEEYNDNIITIINNKILENLNFYNFYVNQKSLFTNLNSSVISSIAFPIKILNDMDNNITQYNESDIASFQKKLISGSLYFMDNITKFMLLKLNDVKTYFLESSDIRQNCRKYFLIFGYLLNYYYDTVLNHTQYTLPSGTLPSSIFVGIKTLEENWQNSIGKPSPIGGYCIYYPKSNIILNDKQYVRSSIDMLNYIFISFLNNLTKYNIESVAKPFSIYYNTLVKNQDIIVTNELKFADTYFDEILLLCYFFDNGVNNYKLNSLDIDKSIRIYFDGIINKSYEKLLQYETFFNQFELLSYGSIDENDAYKIYLKYINEISTNGNINLYVKSQQQITYLFNIIYNQIQNNIINNLYQFSNIVTFINQAHKNNTKHYNLSFYKVFGSPNFIQILNNPNINLADNFISLLNTNITTKTIDNNVLTNYFNQDVNIEFNNFNKLLLNQIISDKYTDYTNDKNLWNELFFEVNPSINNINTIYDRVVTTFPLTSRPALNLTYLSKIAIMNYIPVLVARDIPKMIYDNFALYCPNIINNGSVTPLFLQYLDYRDLLDGNILPIINDSDNIKNDIYRVVVDNCILVQSVVNDLSAYDVYDETYFNELHILNNSEMLCATFRPETLYELTGNIGQNILTWITKKYFDIFYFLISNYPFNGDTSINKEIQNKLIYLMSDIINCFVTINELPSYNVYMNNKSLLSLVPETSSSFTSIQYIQNTNTYCDVISSIWYQHQIKFTELYNKLLNNTLLSKNYYQTNFGKMMNYLIDKTINDMEISSNPVIIDLNDYYSLDKPYATISPPSLLSSYKNIYFPNSIIDVENIYNIFAGDFDTIIKIVNELDKNDLDINNILSNITTIFTTIYPLNPSLYTDINKKKLSNQIVLNYYDTINVDLTNIIGNLESITQYQSNLLIPSQNKYFENCVSDIVSELMDVSIDTYKIKNIVAQINNINLTNTLYLTTNIVSVFNSLIVNIADNIINHSADISDELQPLFDLIVVNKQIREAEIAKLVTNITNNPTETYIKTTLANQFVKYLIIDNNINVSNYYLLLFDDLSIIYPNYDTTIIKNLSLKLVNYYGKSELYIQVNNIFNIINNSVIDLTGGQTTDITNELELLFKINRINYDSKQEIITKIIGEIEDGLRTRKNIRNIIVKEIYNTIVLESYNDYLYETIASDQLNIFSVLKCKLHYQTDMVITNMKDNIITIYSLFLQVNTPEYITINGTNDDPPPETTKGIIDEIIADNILITPINLTNVYNIIFNIYINNRYKATNATYIADECNDIVDIINNIDYKGMTQNDVAKIIIKIFMERTMKFMFIQDAIFYNIAELVIKSNNVLNDINDIIIQQSGLSITDVINGIFHLSFIYITFNNQISRLYLQRSYYNFKNIYEIFDILLTLHGSLQNKRIMIEKLFDYSQDNYVIDKLNYPQFVTIPGFDFCNFDVYYTWNTSYDEPYIVLGDMNVLITDYVNLFKYMQSRYNISKKILNIKNDTVIYNNVGQIVQNDTFIYEKIVTIMDIYKNHILYKYNITDVTTTNLINNTCEELKPIKLSSNPLEYMFKKTEPIFIGVKDIIDGDYYGGILSRYAHHFNSNLQANNTSIKKLMNLLDNTYLMVLDSDINDELTYEKNPYNSFYLKKWFDDLVENYDYTYNDLNNVVSEFNIVIDLLSSQYIKNNINSQYLYTSDKLFGQGTDVIKYIFNLFVDRFSNVNSIKITDIVVSNNQNGNKINIVDFQGNIITLDNGAYDTSLFMSNYIYKNIGLQIDNFNRYGKLKNNTFENFMNLAIINNNDIYFYQETTGEPIILTNLEIRLLKLILNKPAEFAWCKELGHNMMKTMNITINQQIIDEMTPKLFSLQHKLTGNTNQTRGYDILIGNTKDMYEMSSKQKNKKIYVKLPFWFSNTFTPLYMINMIHCETYLNGQLNDLHELLVLEEDATLIGNPKITCKIICNYVYLDEEDRMNFAKSKIENMIEKNRYSGEHSISQNTLITKLEQENFNKIINNTTIINDILTGIQIDFNATINTYLSYLEKNEIVELKNNLLNIDNVIITKYCIINEINRIGYNPTLNIPIKLYGTIKYLLWYIQFDNNNSWTQNGHNTINPIIKQMKIKIFGIDREAWKDEIYFTDNQSILHGGNSLDNGEYLYSFSLYPFIYQPSGTINYTEISDSILLINFTKKILCELIMNNKLSAKLELWGREISILRIMSGMAGFAFI